RTSILQYAIYSLPTVAIAANFDRYSGYIVTARPALLHKIGVTIHRRNPPEQRPECRSGPFPTELTKLRTRLDRPTLCSTLRCLGISHRMRCYVNSAPVPT